MGYPAPPPLIQTKVSPGSCPSIYTPGIFSRSIHQPFPSLELAAEAPGDGFFVGGVVELMQGVGGSVGLKEFVNFLAGSFGEEGQNGCHK